MDVPIQGWAKKSLRGAWPFETHFSPPSPPPFRAQTSGSPKGSGRGSGRGSGGTPTYIHQKRSPQHADRFEVEIMGKTIFRKISVRAVFKSPGCQEGLQRFQTPTPPSLLGGLERPPPPPQTFFPSPQMYTRGNFQQAGCPPWVDPLLQELCPNWNTAVREGAARRSKSALHMHVLVCICSNVWQFQSDHPIYKRKGGGAWSVCPKYNHKFASPMCTPVIYNCQPASRQQVVL